MPVSDWEKPYFQVLVNNDIFFRAISNLTRNGTRRCGIGIRNSAYNLHVDALDHSDGPAVSKIYRPELFPEIMLSVSL